MTQPTVLGYIHEQPQQLAVAFAQRDVFVEPFVKIMEENSIKKILFFGSGTSYNVSVIAAHYFKQIVGIAAEAHYPTVFMNYEKADWSGFLKKEEILFVGISQSGTSWSTVGVMEYAKNQGYHTLVLTGNLSSEITKFCEEKAHLLVGDELLPPETKGYTVSVLSTYLWAISLAKARGMYSETKYKEELQAIQELIEQFDKVIAESEAWYEKNKTTIVNSDRIYILGYGVDFGSALEGQLKIGEMLRIPVLGYELEEYSHGPTMAITKKQTLLLIGSDEIEYERMLIFMRTFRKYSDRVHVLTCSELQDDERSLVFSVKTNKYLAPLMYTVPLQFVAAKGAQDIGIDTSINPFDEPLAHLEEE